MGCIHLYYGDGKGKTTAAVGLAVRFAGSGGRVCFAQFLKGRESGELSVLRALPEVTVLRAECGEKFVFQMTPQEKAEAAAAQYALWQRAVKAAQASLPCLLVLDEALDAIHLGFVPLTDVTELLKKRPQGLELVLTGRGPASELLALADYATELKKHKHPFDGGLAARRGIEF